MKLYIVTVATHDYGYLKYLKYSCKKYNYDLIVLGYGEKWKGFNWRYKLVLNFLNSLNNNDIVCFVDGFDVICSRNLNELPNVFNNLKNKYNCKIIISEQKFAYNTHSFFHMIYFGYCNNKSINAGTYIGYVYDIKEILIEIYNLNPYDNSDDQILLTKYCKYNQHNLYIDSNNEIFLTLENTYKEIDNLLIFHKDYVIYNNNAPFFIHGPGETYLDNIIIKLDYNYDYSNKVKDILLKNFYNKFYFRIVNSNSAKISIVLVIIIIIIIIIYRFIIKK